MNGGVGPDRRGGELAELAGAAVVTGGSGAVGAEVCRLLAERGCDVLFSYRSRREAAEPVIDTAAAHGATAVAMQADLTDPDAAAALGAAALERFGAVHTLIHAAGPHVDQVFLSKVEPDRYLRHLTAEAAGFFNVVVPLLPALRRQRGSIVAVTTVAIRCFPLRDGLSGSPKAAVEGLVHGLAVEEGRYGVRANCVGPGILADGMAGRLLAAGEFDQPSLAAARARIPLGRLGAAAEVAEAACFLASPRAAYITGQTLDVDGGYSA